MGETPTQSRGFTPHPRPKPGLTPGSPCPSQGTAPSLQVSAQLGLGTSDEFTKTQTEGGELCKDSGTQRPASHTPLTLT